MEDRTTVYVVMGTTGEYSYRSEWAVCAYADAAPAAKHADEAKLWENKYGEAWRGDQTEALEKVDWDFDRLREVLPNSPWDPGFKSSYTGTDYYVIAVPVRASLPETAAS